MAGINIPFLANVSGFMRGVKESATGVDDLASALDDMARDGARDADKVGDSVETIGDEGKSSADKLERSFKDALDSVRREGKRTGTDVADDMSISARRAGDSTSEFKDEARQNLSEVASSFSGDISSAADLVQGTLGGLAGSLAGPAGLAAAALAVVGGGLLSSINENAEKAEQRISDMYADMIESGADFLSKDYLAEQLKMIYDGADDAIIKVGELRDLATTAEIPEPLLARALVGDKAAREEVASTIAARRLEINEALNDATAKGGNLAPAFAPAIKALQDIESKVNGTAGGLSTAQRNADAARAAIDSIIAPTTGVASSAEDARSKFDGLGRRIETLPSPNVKVNVDDTALNQFLQRPRSIHVNVVARPGAPQAV